MSNDTPRTEDDARLCRVISEAFGPMVGADFARQLERELNEVKKHCGDRYPDARTLEEIHKLRAELEKVRESLHYSNGVADLAMKHRDAAEQESNKWHAMARELAEAEINLFDLMNWRQLTVFISPNVNPQYELVKKALTRYNELEKSI